MVLERIQKENDIQKIRKEEWPVLAQEIREFLVEKISRTGGHLASNLGVVELTMAMHLCFHLPEDKMIWDVGHQSYTHKLLTGRREGFEELRKYGGMSGFPKRNESKCDAFNTGHSSTSISAGLGYVEARDIRGEHYHVISVIGDGALTGGMAFEALNNASHLKKNFIIVLNDNQMSISQNVGGLSRYLDGIRTADVYANLKKGLERAIRKIPSGGEQIMNHLRKTKSSIKHLFVPGMFFEDMGITYLGPIDGHNMKELIRAFGEAKKVKGAVLLHVLTKKGKGYFPAEREPSRFHGTEPFDIRTGKPLKKKEKDTYTDVFAKVMYEMGEKEPSLVAITAAMEDGTGLAPFHRKYKERFFDVGIAEEHAVTFAAGLAAGGLKPVFAVYSSFLQRAVDQIIHDVALQNLPVVFAVDRGGLVGSDGETHQGIFDLSYLSMVPNMTIISPKNKWELADMIRFAIGYQNGPIAIRYPRGTAYDGFREFRAPIQYGKAEPVFEEEDIALISVGHMFETVVKVRERLKKAGLNASLINARFIKPLDENMISELCQDHHLLVTIEENVGSGGFGERVLDFTERMDLKVRVLNITLPDDYIEHGSVDLLRKEVMLDEESILKKILTVYAGMQHEILFEKGVK